jgi:hypothetical protein
MTYDRFVDVVIKPALLVSVGVSAILLMLAVQVASKGVEASPAMTQAVAREDYADWAINQLSQKIVALETQHATERLDARVSVLEDNIGELKLVSRGVAITVFGQLLIGVGSFLRKRQVP